MRQRKIRQRYYWRSVMPYAPCGGFLEARPPWWPFYGVKTSRVSQ